jgi:hypothetical protein
LLFNDMTSINTSRLAAKALLTAAKQLSLDFESSEEDRLRQRAARLFYRELEKKAKNTTDFLSSLFGKHENAFLSPTPYTPRSSATSQPDGDASKKPNGLWYGCGYAWLEWLTYDSPEWLDNYKYMYLIEVTQSRMVNISNVSEFEAFEREFGVEGIMCPNWSMVAKKYSGIQISPYLRAKRMSSNWYDSWDVASGCIWDNKAILNVKLLAESKPEGWVRA